MPFVLALECCRQVHKAVKKKRAFCLEEIAWAKTASSFSWVRADWRAQPLPPVLSVLHSLTWRTCPIFYFCGLQYELNGPDFLNCISNFDPSQFHFSNSLIDIVIEYSIITSNLWQRKEIIVTFLNHLLLPTLCQLETSLLVMTISFLPPLCTSFVLSLAALPFCISTMVTLPLACVYT